MKEYDRSRKMYYTVPYPVVCLPGITLNYLNVYEAIHEIFAVKKECFFSNKTIMERTNISCERTIRNALAFFEKHKLLKRTEKNGRRYLEMADPFSIESLKLEFVQSKDSNLDDTKSKRGGGNSLPGGRQQLAGGAAPACRIEVTQLEKAELDIKEKEHLKVLQKESFQQSVKDQKVTPPSPSAQPPSREVIKPKAIKPNNYRETYYTKDPDVSASAEAPQPSVPTQGSLKTAARSLPKAKGLSLEDLLHSNPFGIPEDVLQDWMDVREKKRALITNTAWRNLLIELQKFKDAGDNPVKVFEEAVTQGWTSIRFSWRKEKANGNQGTEKGFYDYDSMEWAKNIGKSIF